jgi:hypothetical protein
MLERRRKHHEKLNATSRKQDVRSMSPYRGDGFTTFTNLKDREQGEKPSPGRRQAAKYVDTDTWDPNWEGISEVESWGTGMYHHTQEFRAQEKKIADSLSKKRMRSDRRDRDEMWGGGSSPPSKKRAASKSLLDDIDDPRGEVWKSMTPKQRRQETDFSLNVENPVGYRARQVEVSQTYLWGEDGKLDLEWSAAGESLGLKVTWEPVNGSDETLITKEIRLTPNHVHEDGITWDSDVLIPKGVAAARKSTPANRTRPSAKKDGKIILTRKPEPVESSAGRTPRTRSEVRQEEIQPAYPKFRMGETVMFRNDATLSGGAEPWREGVVTNLIHPRRTNSWDPQEFGYTELTESLVNDGEMEEVLLKDRNIIAVKRSPIILKRE